MTISSDPDHSNEWYYCLKHHKVEPYAGCKSADRLGPYSTPEEAANALQTAAERNEAWDEADREWDEKG